MFASWHVPLILTFPTNISHVFETAPPTERPEHSTIRTYLKVKATPESPLVATLIHSFEGLQGQEPARGQILVEQICRLDYLFFSRPCIFNRLLPVRELHIGAHEQSTKANSQTRADPESFEFKSRWPKR